MGTDRLRYWGRRLEVLRERNFRSFLIGYTTSALGSAMASVALAFAILEGTGSLSDLSLVLAARIVPMVLFLLGGGVLGDRFPRRLVMVHADCLRAFSQGALALTVMGGTPDLRLVLLLAALGGLGEAIFRPCYDGLAPSLVPAERLTEANAVLNFATSAASVAGPVLAGVLIAFVTPAGVLALDAASFVPSILVLLTLRLAEVRVDRSRSALHDLRTGWRAFWALPWLWTITAQFTLFNLLVWGPYLVLGPACAHRYYGGAASWGLVVALYGVGAAAGSVVSMGRRPGRPLVAATLATFGWAAPSAALALRAALPAVCAAAFVAGGVSTVFGTFYMTTVQQRVPREVLSRVMSYVTFGAFSVGPVGLALAGPLAAATSISTVLFAGVGWQLLSSSVVLCVPAIRRVRRGPDAADVAAEPAGAGSGAGP